MSLLAQISAEIGVAATGFVWLLYQVYFPESLHPGQGTKIQSWKNEIRSRSDANHQLLLSAVTVIRGLARADDPDYPGNHIDVDSVDDYLTENGVNPDDFLKDPGEREPPAAFSDD